MRCDNHHETCHSHCAFRREKLKFIMRRQSVFHSAFKKGKDERGHETSHSAFRREKMKLIMRQDYSELLIDTVNFLQCNVYK